MSNLSPDRKPGDPLVYTTNQCNYWCRATFWNGVQCGVTAGILFMVLIAVLVLWR